MPTLVGVSPNGDLWQVTVEGEVVSRHPTRDEAVAIANERAGVVEDGMVIFGDEQLDLSVDTGPNRGPNAGADDRPGAG